jgi:threonine/homoserine/homoserine lactone efflux protein
MSNSVPLLGIAGALAVGAISPGPSFVMVARTAVAQSRAHGLLAALGMGVGGVLFAIAALLGLQTLLAAVPGLYLLMKLGGGAYLLYLGIRIWRGARSELTVSASTELTAGRNGMRSLILGLATQLSNPKTAIVYASVFAAFLPREVPPALLVAVPFVVFAIEAGWYSLVAIGLSAPAPRSAYLRYKAWVDRAAGGVMTLLGIKLISGAQDA